MYLLEHRLLVFIMSTLSTLEFSAIALVAVGSFSRHVVNLHFPSYILGNLVVHAIIY